MTPEQLEILKLILLPLLGGLGAWVAQQLRSRPQKQQEQTSADRASFELMRDGIGWAKTEIKELRQTVEEQQAKIEELERRLAGLLVDHADLQTYSFQLVRWIKDMLRVLDREPSGAEILGKVDAPLPDINVKFPISLKETRNEREPTTT